MPKDGPLALYVAHRRKLLDYASRIVGERARAEDVLQEAFLRFRSAAESRRLDEPVGFLYRVVRNLALDHQRHSRLENRWLDRDDGAAILGQPEDRPSPEQEAITRQELRRVMEAMAELPERTRTALEMHRFGGRTLKEIADHLGISVSMAQLLVMEGVRHCQRAL